MFKLRKFSDAEQAMRKAIQINPYYAEAHDNLGYLLAMQGHFDDALIENRKAVSDRPDFRLVHFHSGAECRRIAQGRHGSDRGRHQ
jgi:protein O-GlcNAc transferase